MLQMSNLLSKDIITGIYITFSILLTISESVIIIAPFKIFLFKMLITIIHTYGPYYNSICLHCVHVKQRNQHFPFFDIIS